VENYDPCIMSSCQIRSEIKCVRRVFRKVGGVQNLFNLWDHPAPPFLPSIFVPLAWAGSALIV
jgi:hypothetical protein